VLQASNPKDTSPSPCQDRCQIWQQEGVLLVALFDGFGSAGHIVSEVCIEECESFFYEKFLLLTVSHTQQSPSDFLVSLFKHLDHILLNNKSEKVLHSGW
jgi:serine/threonine protein phosphatase PrpC